MPLPAQQFSVSLVMKVTLNVAVLGFPPFPKGGTLVLLQPDWIGEAPALSPLAAQITAPGKAPFLLDYEYWHLNDERRLGLLTTRLQPAQIPLGSAVIFLPRDQRRGKLP